MKLLKNNYDTEMCFEENELDKAKRFITDSLESLECEIEGLKEYIEDVKNATTLEEIASAWNSNTDTFENGSEMYVKEI